MKYYTKIATVVAFSLGSTSVMSATWVADARGNGMGNTGVTSADFLLAPFYNPALTAVYRSEDDFGVLLPAVNVNVRDTDDTLSVIDDLQSTIDSFESLDISLANQTTVDSLNGYLDKLDGSSNLGASVGVGAAIALPLNMVSLNLFGRGFVELITSPDIASGASSSAADTQTRYENSSVDVIAFGYTEVGLAIAKQLAIADQTVALGFSPKVQSLRTYKTNISVKNFDISDFDESEVSKSAFNLDLGAVWLYEDYRAGVAVKDLFSQTIDTYDGADAYKLDPQVTASVSYVGPIITVALDVDATKQTRFVNQNDDTQFVRLGVEANAWGWAQLRAGYEIDLEKTLDNSMTLGLGISPADLVSFDIAVSYAGENQLGGAANLAFTF
jgi:hypothetical protein